VAALKMAQEAIKSVGDEVKNTAAQYDSNDQANADGFTKLAR
jgi:hypothetical protein